MILKRKAKITTITAAVAAAFCVAAAAGTPATAEKEAVEYVGAEMCASCHDGYAEKMKRTVHLKLFVDEAPGPKHGCEACHGAGGAHLENPGEEIVKFDELKPAEVNAVCLKCHSYGDKAAYKLSLHARADVSCLDCHSPHPKAEVKMEGKGKDVSPDRLLVDSQPALCFTCHGEKEAEINLPSHHPVKQGKIECSECHSPHSNSPLEMDRAGRKCINCHQEKAGPFRREHRPVAEDCLNCHTPHGSMNQNLLTLRQPGLCLQCHTGTPVTHNTSQGAYKNCNGCHVAIHGSNSTDADSKFNTFK